MGGEHDHGRDDLQVGGQAGHRPDVIDRGLDHQQHLTMLVAQGDHGVVGGLEEQHEVERVLEGVQRDQAVVWRDVDGEAAVVERLRSGHGKPPEQVVIDGGSRRRQRSALRSPGRLCQHDRMSEAPSDAVAGASSDVVSADTGLTAADVADRVRRGLVNEVPPAPSRTVADIIRANVLTRFNLLMGILLAIVLLCGAWKDALFGFVIVANALIGIVQELRAKHTLDQLAVLSAPKAVIVRDGEVRELGIDEIVLDDILELRPGRQVVADGEVVRCDRSRSTSRCSPASRIPS